MSGRTMTGVLAALILVSAAPPRAATAQTDLETISVGQPVESRIGGDDARLAGAPFRAFRFDASGGRRYSVTLTSPDFPAYLRIGRDVGGITDYLRVGGNHGLDAGAVFLLEPEGDENYTIIAQGLNGETGSFTLTVDEVVPGVVRLVPDVASIGVLVGEALHSFEGTAGEQVVITVRSNDFDTMLEVGRSEGGSFVPLEFDDDGAGGTDSRLYFMPTTAGEYLARVREYADGGGGGFAILLAMPAPLPEPRRVAPGGPVEGEITDASSRNEEDIPFDDWTLATSGGERYRIELRSAEFDTYLSVGRRVGSRFDEADWSDDAGGTGMGPTDSRLVLNAVSTDETIVRVRPYASDGRGRYTLQVTQLPPAPSQAAGGVITTGSVIEGELTDADALLASGESYQEWRFTANAGDRFDIGLSSAEFDTNVVIGRGVGTAMSELGRNDDGYDQENVTDSRLLFTAPESGEYTIRVTSFAPGAAGRFRLSLVEGPPPPPAVDRRLDLDAPRSDLLAINEYRLDDGAPFHDWRFDATAGESYVVDLSSPDFDAYLVVGRSVNGEFRELDSNDDFGDGTDSRIVFTATSDGEHLIRARPLFPDGRGRYTLTIRRSP